MDTPEAQPDRLWWCGWTAPYDLPDEHLCEKWPSTMQGWISGEASDHFTFVGAVWAPSEDDAWAVILSCYGESSARIGQRWTPEQKPDDWTPSDRFLDFLLKKP